MSRADKTREVRHTRDAGWEIGVSKTIDRPVDEVWAFITSPTGVAIWLGEGVTVLSEQGAGYETTTGVRGETRSFRKLDRVRLTWQPRDWTHDRTLQLAVWSAGAGRAMLCLNLGGGLNRAAAYTYRWVDRLFFPANPPSSDSILAQYQDLKVGDGSPTDRLKPIASMRSSCSNKTR